jgi:four helix bundle protein
VPVPIPVPMPDRVWHGFRIRKRKNSNLVPDVPLRGNVMEQFDHEKLEVFWVAVDFLPAANAIAEKSRFGDLAVQLRKASGSIVSNITEGAGEFSPSEKARFYRYSRRSATECAGWVASAHKLGFADDDAAKQARAALLRIVSMLTRLITAMEARAQKVA